MLTWFYVGAPEELGAVRVVLLYIAGLNQYVNYTSRCGYSVQCHDIDCHFHEVLMTYRMLSNVT